MILPFDFAEEPEPPESDSHSYSTEMVYSITYTEYDSQNRCVSFRSVDHGQPHADLSDEDGGLPDEGNSQESMP